MDNYIIRRHNVNLAGPKTGQPMVFAAGFGCDQTMWRFVAPDFTDEYQTVLFDYVGMGDSDVSAYDASKYSTLKAYAMDLIDLIDALRMEQVIFVGHSVGCMIGLLAAIDRPELFSKLVMVGPSPYYLNDPPDYMGGFDKSALEGLFDLMEKNYFGWAEYLAPIIMKNSNQPELADELENSFCSTDPAIARNFAQTTFFSDNRDDLPLAPVPSLLLQCADDSIAPTCVGEYVSRHMPESTLLYMEATGHCPHISHPAETIRLIRGFLGEH